MTSEVVALLEYFFHLFTGLPWASVLSVLCSLISYQKKIDTYFIGLLRVLNEMKRVKGLALQLAHN